MHELAVERLLSVWGDKLSDVFSLCHLCHTVGLCEVDYIEWNRFNWEGRPQLGSEYVDPTVLESDKICVPEGQGFVDLQYIGSPEVSVLIAEEDIWVRRFP